MIIFLIANLLLFIKLFLFLIVRLFVINNPLTKMLLIMILLGLYYVLFKYPRKRFNKLSLLRKYKLNSIMKFGFKNKAENFYNAFILICSFFFLIGGIFYLRLMNQTKQLNLVEIYTLFLTLLDTLTLFENCLNIIILCLVVSIYFLLCSKGLHYIKFHIIKRHIYLVGGVQEIPDAVDWYVLKFLFGFVNKIILNSANVREFIEYLYTHLYFKYQHKNYGPYFSTLSFKEQKKIRMQSPTEPILLFIKYPRFFAIILFLRTKGHYFLLSFCILYDIFFNNLIITTIFIILPWTFFYELYLRFSKFIDDLYIPYDQFIHTFVYAKQLKRFNEKLLLIDGVFYDYDQFKKIYHKYILKNFVKDSNDL